MHHWRLSLAPRALQRAVPLAAALLWLSLAALAAGCDDAPADPVADAAVAPDATGLPPAAAAALRLAFPAGVDEVVCNGRALACVAGGAGCTVDLDAQAQGWGEQVIVCQGVTGAPLFAPMIPLVFKDGLPIWAPNLDAAGGVRASAQTTALATAFLSPYLTALYPETARALLAQTAQSPYLDALIGAIDAQDDAAAAAALPPVVTDVLGQIALTQGLTSATRSFGMDHIEVAQTSGYVTFDSRLGTPVDHICVLSALPACALDSEAALGAVQASDAFEAEEIGHAYVPAKSYFDVGAVAKVALGQLFGDLVPGPDLEAFRLTPGRVHDVQCYSGAIGLADEADARQDAVLIAAQPRARYYVNYARVANLVSLAADGLRLLVDFDAFGDSDDLPRAVSACTTEALGPALAVADDLSREAVFDLLKTIQICAVKQLGIAVARRGVSVVAEWVFNIAIGGGGTFGRVTRAGMVLDRVVGLVFTMSPIERLLLAHAVDFEACAPCEDACRAPGVRRCADGDHLQSCAPGAGADACLEWGPPTPCGAGAVCDGEGVCLPCGGAGELCCAGDTCESGHGCEQGICVVGCREECPAQGVGECLGGAEWRACGQHDDDPCLEWGPAALCPAGEVCEVGGCGPPSCQDECEADAQRCSADGRGLEQCGQCDGDGCREWCPGEACDADFVCAEGACACDEPDGDVTDAYPGEALAGVDDSGEALEVEARLWPEGDIDVWAYYVEDALGNTLRPRAEVTGLDPALRYDLCIAYACDPMANGGEATQVSCGDAVRTTRDGLPTCCLLNQAGDQAVDIDIDCTFQGLRDDSGTAVVYLEATAGDQCTRPARVTLTGGLD